MTKCPGGGRNTEEESVSDLKNGEVRIVSLLVRGSLHAGVDLFHSLSLVFRRSFTVKQESINDEKKKKRSQTNCV